MTLVITTCTNRKRKPVSDRLHVSALPQAKIADLATDWASRLSAAPAVFAASEIYGGRAFQEAVLAAEILDAQLMVVSAGLGLVFGNERVPPYSCTVLIDAPDSVGARVLGDFSIGRWWQALSAVSPYRQSLHDVAEVHRGLICAALSDNYIGMIADDLLSLPDEVRGRLRLFTRAPLVKVASDLRPFVMPYDDRLDGLDSPIRGTRSDFAGRALHHFAEYIVREDDGRSATDHADAVADALAGWCMAARFDRLRLDDAAVLDLIREHWDTERGSTARLLRRFRDDLGIACEQGRFADLARQVRGERG
ncbi:hypothetical protein [Sphingomonas sp. BE137]|uniref:hypothetical protein n=1 Tax=Sphingomonas sp. BE137 TaxID=2817844 RepID=UPI001AE7C1E0|nr:hypothetical protein [Sphingomonas sp. BE137]MDR6846953.1 hypothetical protein [Sphingomonas sp. BE137]